MTATEEKQHQFYTLPVPSLLDRVSCDESPVNRLNVDQLMGARFALRQLATSPRFKKPQREIIEGLWDELEHAVLARPEAHTFLGHDDDHSLCAYCGQRELGHWQGE